MKSLNELSNIEATGVQIVLGGSDTDWRTLERALSTWGEHEQRMMAVGETGEFLSMFAREVQHRATDEEWIDEIADVLILMRQMALIYGPDKVAERVCQKLRRLRGILDGQIQHSHAPA